MLTDLLAIFIAVASLFYLISYLRVFVRAREAVLEEPGCPAALGVFCFALYFLQGIGFPDYVLGTVCYRKLKLVDDQRLPGTLVAATIVPGALQDCRRFTALLP